LEEVSYVSNHDLREHQVDEMVEEVILSDKVLSRFVILSLNQVLPSVVSQEYLRQKDCQDDG
jgi:hypothetical protein